MTAKTLKSLKTVKTGSASPAIWHLYIVETRLGHWYTGITTDVAKRIASHQAGTGAKNLKGKGPLRLIHQQMVGNKSEASKLEYKIKQLTRANKQRYVAQYNPNEA